MYEFEEMGIRTTSAEPIYPSEAVQIDGNYLEDAVPGYRTLQVQGRELSPQEIKSITVGDADGDLLQGSRNPSRTITVMYQLICDSNGDFRDKFHKLNSILHGDSHQVVFHDEPDKYWQATMSDVDTVPGGRNSVTSTFTLYIPDGLSHALTPTTATNMPYKDVPVNLLTGTGSHTVTGTNINAYLSNETTDDFLTLFKGLEGQTVTVSVDYEYSGFVAGSSTSRMGWESSITSDSTVYFGTWYSPNWNHNNDSGSGRASYTFVVPKNITSVGGSKGYIQFSGSGTGTLSHLKLEKGSVATPWSPNPADPEYYADTITVDYQGTYPAYPILTATMKSENGLVAFANDKGGVLQFGSPEEVDTVTKVKSDKVIDDSMRPGQTGYTFNVGPITYAKSVGSGIANTFDGSIKFIGEVAEPQFIDDSIKHWHGPSMHRTVPTNSLGDNTGSFIWRTRFNYNTDAKGLGYLEINLTSGSKVIASFAMYDGNLSTVEQVTQYFVNGKQVNAATMNPRLFGNGFYELTVTRNQGRGNFKLSKVAKLNGESVVPGSTYQVPFVDPTFDTAAIDGVTMWLMKFANYKVTSMNISDMKFHWVNVPYIEDVPNRFDKGDVVTVDVANRKIYVNDVLDNTLQTVGNQWESFALQPGTTTIQPVASSWATMYDCKLTYREAWM